VSRESEDDRRQGLRGAGHARNRAARASSGEFLCFQDADDVMAPRRVELQLQSCLAHPEAIVGCSFVREPADSTPRYTNWCNSLSDGELLTHRFRDCTIIQPTWFMSRRVFERVGGYELLLGEDLLFFYRHIELGGTLVCVRDAPLLVYRYHAAQLSHRVPREYLRGLRAAAFERQILDQRSPFYHPRWASFTIWNAGRDGRAFFRLLSMENRRRVRAFCDVDPKLVGREYSNHGEPKEKRLKVPIVHWSEAQPPFVTCFTLDRNMQFERNLAARRLTPGVDVFFFC
jgi:glycosyltransferase involved in cell wall biosynthesis